MVTVEQHRRISKGGGRIALHSAARGGHLHNIIMKYLIENLHCDPSHLDNEKVTPLHTAAQWRQLYIVKYLTLEQHCDFLCTNIKNNTPLHLAAECGHLEILH